MGKETKKIDEKKKGSAASVRTENDQLINQLLDAFLGQQCIEGQTVGQIAKEALNPGLEELTLSLRSKA